MNREEIVERMGWFKSADSVMSDMIVRIEKIVNAAIAEEREECAKIIEPSEEHRRDASWGYLGGDEFVTLLDSLAFVIRKRGEK